MFQRSPHPLAVLSKTTGVTRIPLPWYLAAVLWNVVLGVS